MLEFLMYSTLAIAIGVGALLAYASTKPDLFYVARTARIDAPAERIFPLINDLKAMNTWNPFALNDPEIKGDYSGPASGAGAAYDFQGKRSGVGRIEIMSTSPPSGIAMNLAMLKPMKADNTVEFTLVPQGGSTDVTWAMAGRTPLFGKVLHVFMDMDKMCGRPFEEGLAKLKSIVEARA